MKKRILYTRIAVWLAGGLASWNVQAQFLDYGTDPSRLKWNKVSLEHYKLIYPRGLDSMAYRYALYLENAYLPVMQTIGEPVKMSFPVVLHPANMSSNGMVAWSPRRMELLTTPSFAQHAEMWDRHLVVHESRHVLQTGKLMKGIFRPLYYLMGEQAAGVASFFVPRWFFEGDAVGTETALSGGGRGRLPEFQMVYRAQMLSDSFYSFDKWYLGSYKDYAGSFYTLGYYLTSFARHQYGAGIWDQTTSRYVNHLLSFPPFEKAFKYHTGAGFNRLFRETSDFLRKEWESRDSGYLVPSYHTPPTRHYTSYQYPQAGDGAELIALRSDLAGIPSLVSLSGGREKHLAYPGSILGRIILRDGRIYWIASVAGLRWTHENHTVIKYYDLSGKRVKTLTPRRRYISSAIGDSLAAASLLTEAGESRIVLIGMEDGEEQAQYPTPGNAFIKELTWGGRDTLFALAVGDEGLSLLRLDIRTGQWDELLRPTSANLTSPVYQAGKLYFESGLNGINNIYCMDIGSRKTYRLTSARFGAFQPAFSADGRRLLFADYQAKGYRIASLPPDSLLSEEADFARPFRFTLADMLARQEGFVLPVAGSGPALAFHPTPYHKASHLFRIHSWAPLYYNVSEILSGGASDFSSALKPGASFISQNALNTAVTQAGWYYSDGNHHAKLDFLYMGWFPVIHLNVDYGGKAFAMKWEKNEKGEHIFSSHNTDRNLVEAQLQAYLPLNLTTNHYIRGIQPSVSYYFTNNRYQQYGSRQMNHFQYLLSEIRLYNYRRMSHRDILPRLGYQLRLQYLSLPFNTANYNNLYAARLTTYWPGILPNHSLMLRLGYQYQPNKGEPLYVPKQLLEAPRGSDYQYRTLHQAALKADYAFPVVTPDLSLGSLLYIRRLRANLFYDLTFNLAGRQSDWTLDEAYGGDLLFDWNAMRFSFPLTTGVRVVYPAGEGSLKAKLIFSVSF
ncbi:MAG: hypothetical protein LBS88_04810 [Tannerellaceae bacterium]|nr:hypothetical protein [Tannerellaceae bacterium]